MSDRAGADCRREGLTRGEDRLLALADVAAWPLAARAEQAERTRRIGGRRKTCHLKSGRREE
jgi:hypothetical protein